MIRRAAILVLPHRRPAVRIWKRCRSSRTTRWPPLCGITARLSADWRARLAAFGSALAAFWKRSGWGIDLGGLLQLLGHFGVPVQRLEGQLDEVRAGQFGVAGHIRRQFLPRLQQ